MFIDRKIKIPKVFRSLQFIYRFLVHTCMLSHFSYEVNLWTVASQALLSMGFSRQEYWSELSCPPPEDLPDPGIKPPSPAAPTLQADSLLLSHYILIQNKKLLKKP